MGFIIYKAHFLPGRKLLKDLDDSIFGGYTILQVPSDREFGGHHNSPEQFFKY